MTPVPVVPVVSTPDLHDTSVGVRFGSWLARVGLNALAHMVAVPVAISRQPSVRGLTAVPPEPRDRAGTFGDASSALVDVVNDFMRLLGNISHFLLGVAERPGMSAADHQFKALCKVGSGYDDHSLSQLQQQLEPKWRDFATEIPPFSWASV